MNKETTNESEEKTMKKHKLLKIVALLLAFVMIFTVMPNVEGKAATKKTTISVTAMSIPIGKMTSNTEWFYHKTYTNEIMTAKKIGVKNKVKGATYTFTSSNSKVVKIAKDGGYPTGVKAGKATITCKQKLNGKTTVIGTCKVAVKDANYYEGDFCGWLSLGKTELIPSYTGYLIRYRNPEAKYTYAIDHEGLTLKERVWKEKDNGEACYIPMYGKQTYVQVFDATKAGVYTIAINETYKKKTRQIGTFKVKVFAPTIIADPLEKNEGDEFGVFDLMSYVNGEDCAKYKAEIMEGEGIVSFTEDEDGYYIGKALKEGTAKIKVTEKTTGQEIGVAIVVVQHIGCENIEIEKPIITYVGDDEVWLRSYYEIDPYDTTDSVSVTSKDEAIFRVVATEDGDMVGIAVSEGETIVEVICGNEKAEIPVKVYKDEDTYYEADE